LSDYQRSYFFFVESPQGRSEISEFLSKAGDGGILLDIGGFCGAYSAAFVAAGTHRNAFVFEPLPVNCASIRAMVDMNRFATIELVQCALGDSSSVAGVINRQDGMLRLGDSAADERADFPADTVDRFVRSRGIVPTVIKIDVDGFETEVLRGAKECLLTSKPKIWLELHPAYLRASGKSCDEVIRFLGECGYRISYAADYDPSSEIPFHVWCEAAGGAPGVEPDRNRRAS
jgi:FkbM family methyltransferase